MDLIEGEKKANDDDEIGEEEGGQEGGGERGGKLSKHIYSRRRGVRGWSVN